MAAVMRDIFARQSGFAIATKSLCTLAPAGSIAAFETAIVANIDSIARFCITAVIRCDTKL